MEKSMLRKRPTTSHFNENNAPLGKNKPAATTNAQNVLPKEDASSSDSFRFLSQKWRLISLLFSLLQVGGLSMFISGFFLRGPFHNGEECEMTYSYREFLEIETSFHHHSPATKRYKLYKFVDRRDPRYQRLLVAKQPLRNDSDWCSGKSNISGKRIVLYVPGHWGSYSQSRSVGAHGLHLTRRGNGQEVVRALNALSNNLWTGGAKEEGSFLYDVYSVDFAEQGAALHGKFLLWQSEFVASAVQQLADTCDVTSVTIVAHSMGGLVARLTPIVHPETTHLLRNIITLATPHSNPLYAFDKSIHEVHQRIQNEQKQETLVVSFSGGLKDEMIEPSSCFVKHNSSRTVLSSQLLPHGEFGMDHQAIVWCHGILHEVRKVIWALSMSDNKDVGERLGYVQNILGAETSYDKDLASSVATFKSKFGYRKSICMESAMIYNLPFLLSFFCFIGGLRCAYPDAPANCDFIFLISAIVFGWITCDICKESVVVLCLVASVVHSSAAKVIPVGFLTVKNPTRFVVKSFLVLLFTAHFVGLVIVRHLFDTWSLQYLDSIFFLYTIFCVYWSIFLMVGLTDKSCPRSLKVNFASLVSLVTPVVAVGPLSAISWDGKTDASSWRLLLYQFLSVSIFCAVKGSLKCVSWRSLAIVRSVLLTLAVFKLFLITLHRGQGFVFANLIPAIAWVHITMDLAQYIICNAKSRLTVSSNTSKYKNVE